MAGTGARARKRAAAAERAAAAGVMEPAGEAPQEPMPDTIEEPAESAPVPEDAKSEAAAADDARLGGSLSRYRRPELDAEAERLGIEIDPAWRKGDVVDAIRDYYEAHPVPEGE